MVIVTRVRTYNFYSTIRDYKAIWISLLISHHQNPISWTLKILKLSLIFIIFCVNFIYFVEQGMCYRDAIQESCELLLLYCPVPQVTHCNSPGSCILISIHYPAGADNVGVVCEKGCVLAVLLQGNFELWTINNKHVSMNLIRMFECYHLTLDGNSFDPPIIHGPPESANLITVEQTKNYLNVSIFKCSWAWLTWTGTWHTLLYSFAWGSQDWNSDVKVLGITI